MFFLWVSRRGRLGCGALSPRRGLAECLPYIICFISGDDVWGFPEDAAKIPSWSHLPDKVRPDGITPVVPAASIPLEAAADLVPNPDSHSLGVRNPIFDSDVDSPGTPPDTGSGLDALCMAADEMECESACWDRI